MLSRRQFKTDVPESHRVQMTKRIIKETVVELLKDGAVTQINVKAICKAAGVNRTTFYMHYEDKDQLLEEMVMDTVEAAKTFYGALLKKEKVHSSLIKMLNYYRDNSSIFLTLMKTDYSSTFINLLTETIMKMLIQWKKERGIPFVENDKFRIVFKVSGIIYLIARWLENKDGVSITTIADNVTNYASF